MIGSTKEKTPEELKEIADEEIRKEQKMKCEICDHSGWKEMLKNNQVVRVPCDCTILK